MYLSFWEGDSSRNESPVSPAAEDAEAQRPGPWVWRFGDVSVAEVVDGIFCVA